MSNVKNVGQRVNAHAARLKLLNENTILTPPAGYSFTDYTTRSYDTGVVPNNKITELDFRSRAQGNFFNVFGIQGNYCFYQAPWINSWIGFMNSPDSFSLPNNQYAQRHTVRFSPPENRVWLDGAVGAIPPQTRADTTQTFYINVIRASSGSGYWSAHSAGTRNNEIYSLKVWDGVTNELELYALPVVEDGTGTVRLYDFIEKRFLSEV